MRWVCTAALTASLLTALPAGAYEDDVHFGLTLWLALKAGFSRDDAQSLAAADVRYDHRATSAIDMVKSYACFSRDEEMSRIVKKIHFPSDGPVPGPPTARAVPPGGPEAYRVVKDRIERPAGSAADNLIEFGLGLHPLQDSWSHQGVPDSPLQPSKACDPMLSWGHPAARGGWKKHDADLTPSYPADAMAMAGATYETLCSYRQKLQKSACAMGFDKLRKDVGDFAAARTKTDKAQWFKAQGIEDTAFLDEIDLPDGPGYQSRYEPIDYESASLNPLPASRLAALPRGFEAGFMRDFFTAWMTEKDLGLVVRRWVADRGYRDFPGQGEARAVDPQVLEAQLRFWRVRDHGALAALPLAWTHDLTRLTRGQVADIPPLQRADPYPSLEAALLPLDPTGLPIWSQSFAQPDGRKSIIGVARVRHAAHDLILVVADLVEGTYKVISIASVIDQ